MHPEINRVSNVIAHRNVADHHSCVPTSDTYTKWLIPYVYGNGARVPIYTSEAKDISLTDLSHPVRLFDPYFRRRNNHFPYGEISMQTSYDTSVPEAILISELVRILLTVPNMRQEDILILTVYNKQRSCILAHLAAMFANVYEHEPCTITVSTIAAAQGSESPVVIYSATRNGRRTSSSSTHDSLGLVDDVRGIYVMVTRAMRHLYIVGEFDFLVSKSADWTRVVKETSP